MSVIQSIQEKYAKLMAIIIAVALIIFVVMLAFENGGSLFRGGNSTSVGKVNGESIEYADFMKKVEQQKAYMEQQGYGAAGDMLQQQANDAAWNQEIQQSLLMDELDKLGMKVGKKEMGDMLYGATPPDFLQKEFTDSTGFFNAQAAKQRVDQILKLKNGRPEELQMRDGLITYFAGLETNRLDEKYRSLYSTSANAPRWLIERENADKSQIARISIVRADYASNTDSTIKVSDKEIQDYRDKHKKDFKQTESRSIAYVTFSALPSSADSAAAKQRIMDILPEFDTTKDLKKFLAGQGAKFYDGYITGKQVQIPVKDSIFSMPIGNIYGPYIDGGSYSLAKLLGAKTIPDTVKVRHILISFEKRNPQTGEIIETRDSARARTLIDSIKTAIAAGANFDSLCLKMSDDGGKMDRQTGLFNGGVYDKVLSGQMVPEFNDYIFGNPTGTKGIVRTEFGYHYIEILSQKGSAPAYKVAYVSKPIEVSQETDNNVQTEASLFAGDSRDMKSFDANIEKLKAKGIVKKIATDITPISYMVPGIGSSRAFVKSIYKAKKGEVIDPDKVGDNYVVAIVTEINEEGTLPVEKARPMIEPLLRKKKVAEKLVARIGTPASLEAAATTLGGQIESIDSVRMTADMQTAKAATSINGEPKVLGAVFNPSNKGKIVVVPGENGVYVVRVDDVSATSLTDVNVAEQRKARAQQDKFYSPMGALRDNSTIKDRRSEIF